MTSQYNKWLSVKRDPAEEPVYWQYNMPHLHEWSVEPLNILGNEVASESKMEELQMDSNQN